MNVFLLSVAERLELAEALRYADSTGAEFRVAYDPADIAVKFKIGRSVWSPPFGNVEE